MNPVKTGFSTIQIAAAVIGLGMLIALYIAVDGRGYTRGANETTAKWQARELKQQQDYDAERQKLRDEKDAALAELQGKLHATEQDYIKRVANEKAAHDRTRRAIRDGGIVFNDPGRTTPGEAGCRPRLGDPPAATGGDGATGGQLSRAATEFLWEEAERADAITEQLRFAQDVVTAYYKIAQDCQAGKREPDPR